MGRQQYGRAQFGESLKGLGRREGDARVVSQISENRLEAERGCFRVVCNEQRGCHTTVWLLPDERSGTPRRRAGFRCGRFEVWTIAVPPGMIKNFLKQRLTRQLLSVVAPVGGPTGKV
jgi:hypothetical protein